MAPDPDRDRLRPAHTLDPMANSVSAPSRSPLYSFFTFFPVSLYAPAELLVNSDRNSCSDDALL